MVLRDSAVNTVAGSTSLVVIPAVGGQDSVWRALRHGATTRRGTARWQMTIRGKLGSPLPTWPLLDSLALSSCAWAEPAA